MKKPALLSLAAAVLLPLAVLPAHAGDTLTAGAAAPSFTLPSQDNTPINLSDYKGKWVVLYFYPKDFTGGCTLEAHNFQRDLDKYKSANAVVLGVSLDTTDSHKGFCTKESLTFKLLADTDHKVVDAYGVPMKTFQSPNGPVTIATRQTFLIDPEGKIVKTWDVKDIPNHSADVLAAIAAGGKYLSSRSNQSEYRRKKARRSRNLSAGLFCLPGYYELGCFGSSLLSSCLFGSSLLRCLLGWGLLCRGLFRCGFLRRSLLRCGFLCRSLLCRGLLRRSLLCCFLCCQRFTSLRWFGGALAGYGFLCRNLAAALRTFTALFRGRHLYGLLGRFLRCGLFRRSFRSRFLHSLGSLNL